MSCLVISWTVFFLAYVVIAAVYVHMSEAKAGSSHTHADST